MIHFDPMRPLFIPLLGATVCFGVLGAGSLQGQNPPFPMRVPPAPAAPATQPAPAAAGNDDSNDATVPVLQYPNNPVSDILSLYEKLTNKILIRDATLNASPNLSVISPKPVPKAEAIRLIEASLLLNGYSLVPDSDNRVKVIYTPPTAKNPRSEGVPLYDNPSAIPPGNEVVSYFMQLRFMASSDALTIFQQHVVLHSYGQIIEVPNAQAVVITENAPLIRELIDLQELVDVPPARVVSEFVTLKRADAERVSDTISKLIDAEKSDKQKRTSVANPAQPPVAGNGSGPLYENDLVAGSAQLIPDARTNRILVITRPANFTYIKNLIEEFDEEIGSTAPMERPLNYVSAAEVLPTLADALQENEGTGGQGGQGGGQTGQNPATNRNQQQQQQQQSFANSGQGGSSLNGSNGGESHPDILQEPEDTGPTSLIVGKTHLIADNKANSILVIGPPESQEKVRAILDKLDKRPPQVYLSSVIGQLQLVDNNEFGVDYLKLFQSAGSPSGNNNGFAGSAMDTANALLTPQALTSAAAFPATGGLSVYGTVGKNLSLYVHALQSTNRFRVLARPVVYTENNKRAMISSGQRVPVPVNTLTNVATTGTNSAAVAADIDYEDVVLKLEVIPIVNADNEVNLKIAQVDDSLGGTQTISGNNVPTINTQQITTTVTVPNGDTVVLGGLISESTTNDINGIPILMHLPWVGPLFRDTIKKKERDELIIFIQPTVVDSNTQIAKASDGEKDRAETGKDAYQFTQPTVLPQAELDTFFPKDSKGTPK